MARTKQTGRVSTGGAAAAAAAAFGAEEGAAPPPAAVPQPLAAPPAGPPAGGGGAELPVGGQGIEAVAHAKPFADLLNQLGAERQQRERQHQREMAELQRELQRGHQRARAELQREHQREKAELQAQLQAQQAKCDRMAEGLTSILEAFKLPLDPHTYEWLRQNKVGHVISDIAKDYTVPNGLRTLAQDVKVHWGRWIVSLFRNKPDDAASAIWD